MAPLDVSDLPPPPSGATGWPWTADPERESCRDTPNRPLVSVVTPSYNQAPFLEATIRSVLLQGYPNLEYRVVDGGSTDGSVEIIERYAPFLASWVSEPDRGQTHAINKGWDRSRGDVIAYLNSDDIYLPGAIHASVAFLEATPAVDMVYGSIRHIDGQGRVFNQIRPRAFALKRLVHTCFIPQPAVFLRRSLWERVGPLREESRYTMDYDYWLRVSRYTEPRWLNRFTAGFRYHGLSKSSSVMGRFFAEELDMLDRFRQQGNAATVDASDMRRAYLSRLLYVAGEQSGCAPEQRAMAIERLRAMGPLPSIQAIVSVLGGHDAFIRSRYISSASAGGADDRGEGAWDLCRTLPALEAAGALDPRARAEVSDRLAAFAALASGISRGLPRGLPDLASAARLVARHPDMLASRALWLSAARATSWTAAARALYDHHHMMMDVVRRVTASD